VNALSTAPSFVPNAPDSPFTRPGDTTSSAANTWAFAYRAKVDAAYQRELGLDNHLGVGVRLLEQGYAVSGGDLDSLETAGWLSFAFRPRRRTEEITLAYGYTFYALGYSPLMSVHELGLTMSRGLGSWLRAGLGTGFLRRDTHDDAYRGWDATEVSGQAFLLGRWRPLSVQLGYQVARRWANPTSVTLWSQDGRGGMVLSSDLSALYHGPRLRVLANLPWRLVFDASLWLLVESFDSPETLSTPREGDVWWQQDRRDVRVVASAELKRYLGRGLETGVLFSSIDNISSLDAATPVNQSYSRRQVIGFMRWRWPAQ
jgi:hypothetical protein